MKYIETCALRVINSAYLANHFHREYTAKLRVKLLTLLTKLHKLSWLGHCVL